MSRIPTVEFRTELNLNGVGGTVAGRRYRAVRNFVLQQCKEKKITSRKQCGNALWEEVRTAAISHSTLKGFQAKFNTPRDGPYRLFHRALDSLIADVLKKAAESRKAARMNSDDEHEEEVVAGPSGTQADVAVVRPPSSVYEEKPIKIIYIETTNAPAGTARSLPWVVPAGGTPNRNWLAILRHYTLQELGEAVSRHLEEGEYPRKLVGILEDIQPHNATPDATHQVELIDDDQINAWLRLSNARPLTVACFLHRALAPPVGGPPDAPPVRPNTPITRRGDRYLDPGQFDIAEFYTEPDTDSELEEDPLRRAKRKRGFPRSQAGWEKRIKSNDRRVIRFQSHSRELISRARVKQGADYMPLYADQDEQPEALAPGHPPPGCETQA